MVDVEKLKKLDVAFNAALDCIHIDGALLAADFHLHIGNYQEALNCLRTITSSRHSTASNENMNRIRLWLEIMPEERYIGDDVSTMITNLESSSDIDSLMAQVKYVIVFIQTCLEANPNISKLIVSLSSIGIMNCLEMKSVHLKF